MQNVPKECPTLSGHSVNTLALAALQLISCIIRLLLRLPKATACLAHCRCPGLRVANLQVQEQRGFEGELGLPRKSQFQFQLSRTFRLPNCCKTDASGDLRDRCGVNTCLCAERCMSEFSRLWITCLQLTDESSITIQPIR